MFYDNPRALEPPRLPLQTEDEPEFIKYEGKRREGEKEKEEKGSRELR